MKHDIQCPRCRKTIRVPDKLRGKTVRCPASGCGARVTVPADPSPQGIIGFKPDEEEPPARPPVAPAAQPGPLPADGAPYLEVRVGDGKEGKVEYTDLVKVRELLLRGVLTRHTKVRWVEAEPDEHDYREEQESFREARLDAARRRWQKRQQWRRIGDSLAVEEPAIEELYCLRVRPDEDVAAVGAFCVALAAVTGVAGWLIWYVAANTSESESGGAGFWEALAEGNLYGAWRSYQSTLWVCALLLAVLLGVGIGIALVARVAYKASFPVIGWAVGYARYRQRLKNWEQPPDDGYTG
jgi:hypothetical protein